MSWKYIPVGTVPVKAKEYIVLLSTKCDRRRDFRTATAVYIPEHTIVCPPLVSARYEDFNPQDSQYYYKAGWYETNNHCPVDPPQQVDGTVVAIYPLGVTYDTHPASLLPTTPRIPEELHGYENPSAEGGYAYPCRVCQEESDIYCEPEEFDPDMHYCGRSPSCCP